MKPKKLNQTLTLNRQTITDLNDRAMNRVVGGHTQNIQCILPATDGPACTVTCFCITLTCDTCGQDMC